jgi:hypothetical protein
LQERKRITHNLIIKGALMKQITQPIIRTTIGLALCFLLLPTSFAQNTEPHKYATPSDQAGWSRENTSSPYDYLQTLKKEAGAALHLNMSECKSKRAKARSACEREARAIYKQDLIDAEQKAKELNR